MLYNAKYAKALTFLIFKAPQDSQRTRKIKDYRGSVTKHKTLEFVFKSKAKS